MVWYGTFAFSDGVVLCAVQYGGTASRGALTCEQSSIPPF